MAAVRCPNVLQYSVVNSFWFFVIAEPSPGIFENLYEGNEA